MEARGAPAEASTSSQRRYTSLRRRKAAPGVARREGHLPRAPGAEQTEETNDRLGHSEAPREALAAEWATGTALDTPRCCHLLLHWQTVSPDRERLWAHGTTSPTSPRRP